METTGSPLPQRRQLALYLSWEASEDLEKISRTTGESVANMIRWAIEELVKNSGLSVEQKNDVHLSRRKLCAAQKTRRYRLLINREDWERLYVMQDHQRTNGFLPFGKVDPITMQDLARLAIIHWIERHSDKL